MITLQMSSPSIREEVLQLYPGMIGITKSRAMEALAQCFVETDIEPEVFFFAFSNLLIEIF